MLLLYLPGLSVTYQGEEIGMTDNINISWQVALYSQAPALMHTHGLQDTLDPAGCACGQDRSTFFFFSSFLLDICLLEDMLNAAVTLRELPSSGMTSKILDSQMPRKRGSQSIKITHGKI